MSIKKYGQFINEEVGMRNIKNITSQYKKCNIYFHQDLDGVASALAMKHFLYSQYGVQLNDCHIIQYGGIQYAVKKTPEGIMPVLVDFANAGSTYVIATDHHDRTRGIENVPSGYSKAERSNAQTLSGEIPKADAFPEVDIDLIKTVDSADFLSKGIKPEDISNSIFNINKDKSGTENRFMMGFVVNRLMLAYKNKTITVKSLDGKRQHTNKNILECLVMDCTPSLVSLYSNLKHYINNAESENWNRKTRQYDIQKLATPEDLQRNQNDYVNKMKDFKDLSFDKEYNINTQVGGGNMFEPGSYDRYTVFRNNPDIDFNVILWPMGLLQASCNPFKEKVLDDINLGAIAKKVLAKFETPLKKIFISIEDIKRISESDIEKYDKIDNRHNRKSERIGFRFEDLVSFYKGMMKYQPNIKKGDRTLVSFDGESNDEYNKFVRLAMDKLHTELSKEERSEIANIKISAWDIIMANSGGHKSITNISGLHFLSARKDGLKLFFGSDEYVTFCKMLQKEFVSTLKIKIDEEKAGQKITADETPWGNTALTESKRIRRSLRRFNESVEDNDLLEIKEMITSKYENYQESSNIINNVLVVSLDICDIDPEEGSYVPRTECTIKVSKESNSYKVEINGISGQYGCDEPEDDFYEVEMDYLDVTDINSTIITDKENILQTIDEIINEFK